ncbi:GntR family transcriptional regulator [Devosia sp. CN2-171]|uniref:GntR family transcriptional regulator n=1 Tax=Devosia sp. CN2-171 TaxID=3400909 RepID=UPI003BF82FE2
MKTDTLFKRAYNDALLLTAQLREGEAMPSETVLAARLAVSRTTVRKILSTLAEQGVVGGAGRQRFIRVSAGHAAPFPEAETVPTSVQVEKQFMEWMLRGDAKAGSLINELDLARQFGVATTVIREFLNSFQRFGLIERRPSGGWVLQGFTGSFAFELIEIREMFELRSAKAFAGLPETSPLWQELRQLRTAHVELLGEIDARFQDFSDLDSRFHRLVNAAAPNRFIDGFYDIITLIFHYHYQWNKKDERERNEVAIEEHLAYIDALLSRSRTSVVTACRKHLASARQTLVRSTTNDAAVG